MMLNRLFDLLLVLPIILVMIVFSSQSNAFAYSFEENNIGEENNIKGNISSEQDCIASFVNSNFYEAFLLCSVTAEEDGSHDAQLLVGLMYIFGEGTEKNNDLAKFWLNKATLNGSEEAKKILIDFKLMD